MKRILNWNVADIISEPRQQDSIFRFNAKTAFRH